MLDENKKENRRKNLNTKKKKVNSKKRFQDFNEDASFGDGHNIRYEKNNIKADEIWEEWNNREND
jgi:hypothetical protein